MCLSDQSKDICDLAIGLLQKGWCFQMQANIFPPLLSNWVMPLFFPFSFSTGPDKICSFKKWNLALPDEAHFDWCNHEPPPPPLPKASKRAAPLSLLNCIHSASLSLSRLTAQPGKKNTALEVHKNLQSFNTIFLQTAFCTDIAQNSFYTHFLN